MSMKLIGVIIAALVIVNGILFAVAIQKRTTTPTSNPAQIVREPTIPKRVVKANIPTSGLENCFNYYNYGNTQVNLSPEKTEYSAGENVKLIGNIINNNTFPIVDVVLYAQIKRLNPKSYDQNGHYLIDTYPLLEKLNIQAFETKPIEVQLPFKNTYPQGPYQIQYFVFSTYGFHYGGRPFFEEDYAGTTNLTVKNTMNPSLYFDIDTLEVDGKIRTIRGVTDEFSSDSIPFDIHFVDARPEKLPIPVTVKFYNFEDTHEANVVKQYTFTVDHTNTPLHVEFTPPEQGAYVLVASTDTPISTMIKYRFGALSGTQPELRMNDVGVSSFPATKEGRAWVCLHSPSAGFAQKTKISLALLDDKKQIVAENSVNYALSQDVLAISVPFENLSSLNDFALKAIVANDINPSDKREVQIEYTCDLFTQSLHDFNIIYNKNSSQLIIKATNNCGKEIREGKINNIRVMQNKKIVKEATNVVSIPYTFSLSGIPAGQYLAQVKIGERVKEIPVDVPTVTVASPASKKSPILLYAAVLILGSIIVAIIFMLIRRKR